ncbi:MAG TPA: N-formylglutamate deformylase [Burkholderiaceae bacterium]|nr:N-formylglutamate deformylase [Burkholderiaceae bacterium]
MSDRLFSLHRGKRPLLVSLPHVGTEIPHNLQADYVPHALEVEDTDWHLASLYALAKHIGASLIAPRISRYVIDLNRPPENAPMYPGANNTELCPTRSFAGQPLYKEGHAPDEAEIEYRRRIYWQPYHDMLAAELDHIRRKHGYAVLWDGHSIKSELPWLFEGKLPDLNLGTAGGTSCSPVLTVALGHLLQTQNKYTHVIDGRFKGGYITRHYGRPDQHVHAVQLEMCFSCYMHEEPPYMVDAARAGKLLPLLRSLLLTALACDLQSDLSSDTTIALKSPPPRAGEG